MALVGRQKTPVAAPPRKTTKMRQANRRLKPAIAGMELPANLAI